MKDRLSGLTNSNLEFLMSRSIYIVLSTALVFATLMGCRKTPQQKAEAFLLSGEKHVAAHDYERAVLDFRNAIQLAPKNAEAHYQLALAYTHAGDVQAAAHELISATRINPAHAAAQLKLAELMSVSASPNVVKEGGDRARQVLASQPNDPEALRTLAMSELRLDDTEDAVEHLQQSLSAAPQDLQTAQALAIAKLRQNDVQGAEDVLLKCQSADPKSPQPALALGRFYQLVAKPDQAERQFRLSLTIDPNYGPSLVALGNYLATARRLQEAEQIFRRASSLPDVTYRPLHAIFLFRTGNPDAAVQELKQQFEADRKDRAARTRLLTAYLKLDRINDARNILDAALKENPRDSEAALQRGELNLMSGRLDDAHRDLTEALHGQRDSAKAHLLLARYYLARGDSANQIRELTEALRIDRSYSAARLELADSYTRSGKPKAALDVLDQALFKDKQALAYVLLRNAALFADGDDAALKESLQLALATSSDPKLLMQDGLLKVKLKDYRGARISFEAVLKQQPQNWPAVQADAASYLQEKNNIKAVEVARTYASRFPDSAPGQQVLGSILLQTGDVKGAALAFEHSRNADPKWTPATLGLVEVALRTNKLQDAANLLSEVLNREPRNTFVHFTFAEVEDRLGNTTDAVREYEKVLELDPANVQAMNDLAYALADSRIDPKRALALAQSAKERQPDDPAIDDTMGWAYYNNGLFQLSVNYLERAAKSGTARRKSHLAMAYIKLGDRRRASTLLQAALKDEPASPEAHRGIELLSQMR